MLVIEPFLWFPLYPLGQAYYMNSLVTDYGIRSKTQLSEKPKCSLS